MKRYDIFMKRGDKIRDFENKIFQVDVLEGLKKLPDKRLLLKF